MSDTETEGRLDALARALSEDEPENRVSSGAERANGKAGKRRHVDEYLTEPYSGIRYKNPKIQAEALDSSLDRFTPLNHLDKLRDAVTTVSTIAIVGRRTFSTSSKGSDYIKWQLTDLKECNVQCFAFANAATVFSQVRPGSVVAVLRASYDGSQQGCLKINDAKQLKEVGISVDFDYCAGHNWKGERCQNVVNKSTCPFCDYHLQQGRKKLVMGARPECQGTVLGAVHGAQIKNPACLTKLSKRTPKKKKPKSLDDMSKCAGQISNQRSGSMGAKLIARFVQQQHQASRSAKIGQEERALYKSPEKDSNGLPLQVPACTLREPTATVVDEPESIYLKPRTGKSKASHKGTQRQAQTAATQELPAKAQKHSSGIGTCSKGPRPRAENDAVQPVGGAHLQSVYVTDLLQEIAADHCRTSQDTQFGGARRQPQHNDQASIGKTGHSRQYDDAKIAPAAGRLYATESNSAIASKRQRAVSTERRVRQVLTELRQ